MYEKVIKRSFDIVISSLSLILLSWLFLLIMLVIVADDPGPVFFRQKRVGKNGKYFSLFKFRTMRTDAPHDTPTHLLTDPEKHITRVGRFLRKSSLDELPQLINIFTGKMSLIGPRPALWNQYDLLEEREKYGANSLRPGLTGWAQINGRDEISNVEKAKLDGEYAEKIRKGGFTAFGFDVKCFIGTIFSVAKAEGVREGKRDSRPEEADRRENE
ncbi:MAG: sugar transferase [Clostridia bacterium]|nr:sugar transferase [Clostridia bacterium]